MTLNQQDGIFTEQLHPHFWQSFTVEGAPVVAERSRYQLIEIFDSPRLGRVLALDKVVQLTTRDESAYAEMLTHVPILEHGAVRRVLIVGGGDASIAEEALKHAGVTSVEMAEIDERVVALCREHFADMNAAAFADARFRIHIIDAAEFLKAPAAKGAYDLIISDRPDPIGPGEALFHRSFYESVSAALAPGGIAVFQTGCPFFQPQELKDDLTRLRGAFRHAGAYVTVVPTYIGGFMTLSWASNGHVLGGATGCAKAAAAFAEKPVPTDHYTPALHRAAFALPAWIARLADEAGMAG